MPFHIGSGCLPATISNRRIYRIAWSDTPPEMSSVGRQSILDSDRVVWKFPQALTGAG